MFSKSKINEPGDAPKREEPMAASNPGPRPAGPGPSSPRQPKPAPSIISSDLTIRGDLETTGDMQIEGTIEGDIRSHLLTIGQNALVKGEIVADDVVVNGRVEGTIRGAKVRLSASARVSGDILHKTIAIESGAQFEGSVQRSDDPISQTGGQMKKLGAPRPAESANAEAQPQPGARSQAI
ncbi:MAG: polymer-forming cytoskeletal protein [Pseudomonadota bacterium]